MAQRGGGGGEDNSESWVIIFIIFAIVLYILFNHFFWVFATGWKWLRTAEVMFLSFIVPDFVQNFMKEDFRSGLVFLSETNPKEITASIVGAFDNIYVRYFNWLPGIFILYLGFRIFNNAENVTMVHDMETMIVKMSRAFPHNKSFLGIHPEQSPIDFYPDDPSTFEFSMAMTDRQFATQVPPLGLEKLASKNASLKKPIWDGKKGFDQDLARKSFDIQLGKLYRGYQYMNTDERRLFDLFRESILVKQSKAIPIIKNYVEQAIKGRKGEKAYSAPKKERAKKVDALKPIAFDYVADISSHKALGVKITRYVDTALMKSGGKWLPQGAELRTLAMSKEFKDLLKNILADEIMSKHAYTYTGLMSMLEAAREGKTLAPSSLRWLKGKNRTLWYAINCVGKKVAFAESAGTFAHWLLECEAGIAVPHPEVTEAVEALKVALGLKHKHGEEPDLVDWS